MHTSATQLWRMLELCATEEKLLPRNDLLNFLEVTNEVFIFDLDLISNYCMRKSIPDLTMLAVPNELLEQIFDPPMSPRTLQIATCRYNRMVDSYRQGASKSKAIRILHERLH